MTILVLPASSGKDALEANVRVFQPILYVLFRSTYERSPPKLCQDIVLPILRSVFFVLTGKARTFVSRRSGLRPPFALESWFMCVHVF